MEELLDIFQPVDRNPESRFTPVRCREREQPADSPVGSNEVPWTAARCNRLLRPLSSRVALLRKQKEKAARHQTSRRSLPSDGASTTESQPVGRLAASFPNVLDVRRDLSNKREADPEWVPDQVARKRLKRTYSSRGAAQSINQLEKERRRGVSLPPVEQRIEVPVTGLQCPSTGLADGFDDRCAVDTNPHLVKADVSTSKAGLHGMTRETFRRLAKSVSPSEWMLNEGLYNGLDALLIATAKKNGDSNQGRRSLFGTCLRSVPAYIALEQAWADEEEPDSVTDVASSVYTDLESYGLSASGGWRPLRKVVRAHGIYILGVAIQDGSISPQIARGLIILCLQAFAYSEAQTLCTYLLRSIPPLARPKLASDRLFGAETSISLQTLNDLSRQSECWNFFFRMIASLLQDGIVPVEWISSPDMIHWWNRVIRSIVQDDAYAGEASNLLRTAMSISLGASHANLDDNISTLRGQSRQASQALARMHTRDTRRSRMVSAIVTRKPSREIIDEDKLSMTLTTTVTNLVTVLLSVHVLNSDGSTVDDTTANGTCLTVIHSLAVVVGQGQELAMTNPTSNFAAAAQMKRACLLLLGEVLLAGWPITDVIPTHRCHTGNLALIASLERHYRTSDTLGSFLGTVAHCCARPGRQPAFNYLQSMVGYLSNLASTHSHDVSIQASIHRIVMAAALEFAEQTAVRAHLNWALEVEEVAHSTIVAGENCSVKKMPDRTPIKSSAGFRWEEGICEWVAKTPYTTQAKSTRHSFSEQPWVSTARNSDTNAETWLARPERSRQQPLIRYKEGQARSGRKLTKARRRATAHPGRPVRDPTHIPLSQLRASTGRGYPIFGDRADRSQQGSSDNENSERCASTSPSESALGPCDDRPVLEDITNKVGRGAGRLSSSSVKRCPRPTVCPSEYGPSSRKSRDWGLSNRESVSDDELGL